MELTSITIDAIEQAEHNLLEAGFSFTTVDGCAHRQCEVCAPGTMCTAA